tara:strand:+ start:6392 stop:6613 length:222 start_codon:yes stop_codon:yes gene_type:complete
MDNIKVKKIEHFGYLQGYKIFINKKKYPQKHSHYYTTLDQSKAIYLALQERKYYNKFTIPLKEYYNQPIKKEV